MLGEVNRETLNRLNESWTASWFEQGSLIVDHEEKTTDVFFLLTGSARATTYTESGREISLVSLQRGDCFGEFAAIDDAPRSASVLALEQCRAARLSARRFREIMASRADLSYALSRLLIHKLRELTLRVADFNTLTADARVRRAILKLAYEHSDGNDRALVVKPPTQADLASYVFTNREGVAREMGRMKRAGLIARQGRSLKIPSIERLGKYVSTQ